MKTVLITSVENSFDEKLAAAFVREGLRVFAMGDTPIEGVTLLPCDLAAAAEKLEEEAGSLDYLLETSDACERLDTFTVRDGLDIALIERTYRRDVLRPMATLEAFLPLLDKGEGKRLFFLTSAQASVNETRRVDHFGYNMSKAAMHQFIQMIRNKLTPLGYTFRVFDPMPCEISPEGAAESAYQYITRRRGTENHDPKRDDEDNLVFRDAQGRQHAW